MSRPLSRRGFLDAGVRSAGLLAASSVACDSERPHDGFLGLMERVNERFQRALFDPERLAPELAPEDETNIAVFPQYKISTDFPVAPANWTLVVGGLVKRPMTLSLADLQRLPRSRTRVRHHCVEGWSAVASWDGVRVSEVASLVRPHPDVRYVEFRSFDSGYYSSWDLESALHPQTILAYAMHGELLPAEHGAPLRLYSAVKLGYKMVKYIMQVNFLPVRTGGYWEDQGYEWFAGV